MHDARRTVALPEPLRMRNGAVLQGVTMAYETWGTLSPKLDNVLLILTGLSPSAHARSSPADPTPGWWEEMIGPGLAIDTNRFHVVCVNTLGSCHGSTGAASVDPHTGMPYRLTFPVLTVEDMATAARETLHALGLPRVRAIVGPSLGGMAALAYAALFPGEVDALASISGAARAQPLAIAIRSLQREAIRSDPAWQAGNYAFDAPPSMGMRIARKLGLISYRSAREWKERFGRERVSASGRGIFGAEFEIESYLEVNARKFIGSFDANCYLYLSRAMDLFDMAEHGGTVEAGLSRITSRDVLVIGVETDFLFPIDQQEEIATVLRKAGRNVRFEALPSIQGHDSFLVDMDRFSPVLGGFLREV